MSGKSSWSGSGRMTAPERLCAPQTLPFSRIATGTSPSDSSSSGSSARSCRRRLAVARPAVPPPTIATPTSIRSSSASSSRLTTSLRLSPGGGSSAGAWCPLLPAIALAALLGLHGLGQLGQDLVEVADDPEVGELEDRSVRVLVDRDDVLRVLHADLVLDRAGDPRGQVQLRRDGLARLADLRRVGVPAGVDDRAGRRHGAAQGGGELLAELEALGLAETAAAGDQDRGVLDVHVGATLLAALEHLRLLGVLGELDVDVLDLRRAAAGLDDLERVEAPDDDAAALVLRRRDRRVAQDRALGLELAVDDVDLRDLHRHAGVQARGKAGADLEAEQAAAEQRVVVAVGLEQVRHRVDDRLGQALGRLDAEDLGRAVLAERRGGLVGDALADDDRVTLGPELLGDLGGLGDRALGVLVDLALVVE